MHDQQVDPQVLQGEFAFEIRLEFPTGPRLRFGPLPEGGRSGFVPVVGGTVTGPRLQGKVIPYSGGDWPHIWPDGTLEFDARYMLEANDGTLIYVQSRGLAHATPEVAALIEAGQPFDRRRHYFRTAPIFKTAVGPHDWLCKTIFVGFGEKHANHSLFAFHAIL